MPSATINQHQSPHSGEALEKEWVKPCLNIVPGPCWRCWLWTGWDSSAGEAVPVYTSWTHSTGPPLFPLPRETHLSVEISQRPGGLWHAEYSLDTRVYPLPLLFEVKSWSLGSFVTLLQLQHPSLLISVPLGPRGVFKNVSVSGKHTEFTRYFFFPFISLIVLPLKLSSRLSLCTEVGRTASAEVVHPLYADSERGTSPCTTLCSGSHKVSVACKLVALFVQGLHTLTIG